MEAAPRDRTEITALFRTALVIFIVTVLIGIANGTKVFGTLDRNVLLTHLHAGTIGWITLGAVALTMWLFAAGTTGVLPRRLAVVTAVTVVCYVAAFLSGHVLARAVFGGLTLAAIIAVWLWTVAQARRVGWSALSTAQLGATLALSTLVIGSTLGVYGHVLYVTANPSALPQTIGGHAGAQTAGYLVLMAVAACEAFLRPGDRRTRVSTAQVFFLFAAGALLAVGLLAEVQPLLGLASLCQLIGTIIFITRMAGPVRRAAWLSAGPGRHFAIAVPFLLVNIGLTTYLVSQLIGGKGFEDIPRGLVLALDHSIFVGVMTNVLFGLVSTVAARSAAAWSAHVLFWGMNLGLVAFLGALISAQQQFETITAPVMGVSILVGIAVGLMRLRAPRAEALRTAGAAR